MIAIPLLGLLLSACIPRSQGASAITVEEGIIYSASPQGKVLAIDPEQRRLRGQASFPGDGEWVSPPEKGFGIVYAQPLPNGDTVLVATFDGKVLVLSRATGALRGEEPLFPRENQSETQSLVATPVLAGDTLLIAVGNQLHAVSSSTGQPRWARPFQARNRIWASPVLLGDKVIVGSLDGRLYAVELDTGEKVWSFEAGGGIASTPLVAENTIYFGSFDGRLYAIDSDGQEVWASPIEVGEWVWSHPFFYEGTVYFGALDGVFYAVEARRGRVRWSQDVEESIRAAPALEEGVLVIATTGGSVYGVNPANGTILWQRSLEEGITVSADLAGYDGEVYVASEQGTLYALKARTGEVVWTFPLKQ